MNKTSTIIINSNNIGKIISTMLVKQSISNKTPKKSMSYYIIEQMNDHIDSNTDNTNDDQITNMDNSLEFTKNTSKNLQNNVFKNLLFMEISIHL